MTHPRPVDFTVVSAIDIGRMTEAKALSARVEYIATMAQMWPEQEREATLLAALDVLKNSAK